MAVFLLNVAALTPNVYGKTWVWSYDAAGNIISKTQFAYTTAQQPTQGSASFSYQYGNASWGDLLTNYNGKPITYDAIGNPLSDGTWSYTWEQGRQLARMTAATGAVWNFTYDANGMRMGRTGSGGSYTYIYNGSQLSRMYSSGANLAFTYGADSKPLSVKYNGTTYYYVTNLQGDVIAILDSSGTMVVEYTYDAWGKPLTTTGTMANTLGLHNPLRYRGYVYDRETGLYYLQSRYYNPTIGRFINADGLVATGQGLTGNNMFAYCRNNPVMYADPTGEIAISTIVWIIVGVAALATVGTITYGAVTDTPVVVDISGSAGTGAGVGVKVGLSVVIDFKNDSFGFYPHYGYYYGMKYNTFGGSYSVGLIQNYENEGDYAGPFTSMGGGYLGGVDHCYDPRYSHDDTVKADSLTFGNNKGVYYGYDYYGYWGSVPFPWRDQ